MRAWFWGVLGGVGYIAPAVSPIWFTAIVIVLVRDFAESIAVQQQQNVLMAQRLAEQQQELLRLHAEEQRRARERAAEEERQRIMQDMHDGLGSQLLTSLAAVERGALDVSNVMGIPADDPYAQKGEPPVWNEYRAVLKEARLKLKLEPILKWDFYEAVQSPDHVLTVQTGDQALWANVLLSVGCRQV